MNKTMAPIGSIAMAFLCIGIAGCANQASHAYRTSSLADTDQPIGRVCLVSDQSCLSMMAESPRTCLTGTGRCDPKGGIQPLDLSIDRTLDLRLNSGH
jgi:hypothetical protein